MRNTRLEVAPYSGDGMLLTFLKPKRPDFCFF